MNKFFVYSNSAMQVRMVPERTKPEFAYELSVECDEIGDQYHTMHELYQHRMALNMAFFHLIAMVSNWESASETMFNSEFKVMKSKLHHDGTMFDGYFIVMLTTPFGQISYHYKLKHWDEFNIPEVERTPEYDGHTSLQVLERLMKF